MVAFAGKDRYITADLYVKLNLPYFSDYINYEALPWIMERLSWCLEVCGEHAAASGCLIVLVNRKQSVLEDNGAG